MSNKATACAAYIGKCLGRRGKQRKTCAIKVVGQSVPLPGTQQLLINIIVSLIIVNAYEYEVIVVSMAVKGIFQGEAAAYQKVKVAVLLNISPLLS